MTSPYETVERADHLDVESMCFLKERLNLNAVLSYDVCVVTACLVHIFVVKVHFISKECPVECSEGSESVCGEENASFLFVSDHNLRPVNHRRHHELQSVMPCIECGTFFYNESLSRNIHAEELINHGSNLFVAYDFGIRISEKKLGESGRMVRLHVLNNYKVQLAACQSMFYILEEYASYCLIYCIEKHCGVVQQKIGVIGNSSRNGVHTFKHGQTSVVGADPD